MHAQQPLFRGAAHALDDTRVELATLIGADFSALSITPQDAQSAPKAVRAALARFAPYDATRDIDLRPYVVIDLGDAGARHRNWEGACDAIRVHATTAWERGQFMVGLGGDHSVTWPLVSAVADGNRVGLIQLDAHHDVRPLDSGPSNGTPIRGLIEEGVLHPHDIVQIGIHPFANHPSLGGYCRERGIHTLSVEEVRARGAQAVAQAALEHLASCDFIYLTVDIDVLDRSFAPGTVGAMPGGLTPEVLLAVVEHICMNPRVRAMDVVEFDPDRDVAECTARSVAGVVMSALASVAIRSGST